MSDGLRDLASILESIGLPGPTDAPPADLGSPRRTHVFVVGDVVVKCDAAERVGSGSMVREASALGLLVPTGLPVPRLLQAGELADGRRWVVVSRLDGAPPPDAARPAHELSVGLAAQIGAVVARLHAAATPPEFGTWDLRPTRTFLEEHWHRIGILEGMARRAAIVAADELADLLALLRATAAPLDAVTTPVLAHRDVQPRNVLVDDDGTVTALLDFESSAGGDPAEDFRVIGLTWDSPAFAAFAASYAGHDDADPFDRDFAERITHYVLEWALAIFAYLGGIAPAYLAPARAAIERARRGDRPPLPT